MPIPKPKNGEPEKDFISRCMKEIGNEYEQTQALAICYNQMSVAEKMKKQEELFVLTPKKAENRGKYLSRCSSNVKMKEQFPNMKERMGNCLNAFNAYYKYWNRLEEFSEKDTKGTNLGECIAREKAKGFDYKEAYNHCASRVVAQPTGGTNPQVLSADDDLLIEPVEMDGLDDACWEGYEPIGLKDRGDGRMVPNCVPIKMTDDDFAESITDYPDGVKNAAKRVLDFVEKNGWGSCGTGVGKQRANQLAKGEPISVDTVKRMYSYLSRHKVDLQSSKSYTDGCGKIMFDAWGGEAALSWSERKLKQLEE